MPISFKSYVHLLLLRIHTCFIEYKKWRTHKIDSIGCNVYYGYDHIPKPSERASGGIIKCQDLQLAFPNRFEGANILYLVSSALPLYPKYLLKNTLSKGVKLVWNQNGVAYPAWHGPGWEKTNEFSAYWIHKADSVIYQSEFCKCSADRYLGSVNGAWQILHNPVDTETFTPAEYAKDGFNILLAGTHNEWYRMHTALKTFQKVLLQIPKAKLYIAGPLKWKKNTNEARKELNDLCRSLGLEKSVNLLGPYKQTEAVALFQGAHLLLHTQYNDACPRLVVEAMACGLPVVYSSSGGTPELVGEDSGIGIKAAVDWNSIHTPDPELMSAAVYKIFRNYEYYSKNARERAVTKFDVRPWVEQHENIFKNVLQ